MWVAKNVREQLGFISGIGPETARCLVFRQINHIINEGKTCYTCQIDL